MNGKLFYLIFMLGFAAFFAGGCNSGESADSDELAGETLDSADIREEIIVSMLAPSDMAVMLIDNPNLHFNKEILNPGSNYQKYNTNAKIALNIGIYTADLSYASLFEQEQITYDYLDIVKDMSEEIGITQSIEKRHLDMIKNNKLDKDDMIKIINESFMNTDAYLRENNRQKVITMILIGGWIEAQYIAVSLSKCSPDTDPQLTESILAQKISLELMNKALENVKGDKTLLSLKNDIDKIYKAYLLLEENMNDENFKNFCNLIISVRNRYIA
ncbi:MAG: hypothetical protein GXO50_08010 [Chlorobi bacterium]|nr:hypothetical protein [Chlorobiota bacterium]